MRERRWESHERLQFHDILQVGERLSKLGLKPAVPEKDLICYIEEWQVNAPEDFDGMDPWATEDVTLIHAHDGWRGDFYLLAGEYHTVFRRHRHVGTYCSISHPWRLQGHYELHHPRAMFWVGFRHLHGFIRLRLHTREVITPGETRGDHQRDRWLAERCAAFDSGLAVLQLPVQTGVAGRCAVVQGVQPEAPLFCSWPDAFGPCQFEYNSSDAYEFLVPASRLASTWEGEPAAVRAYLTGFSEEALEDFRAIHPEAQRLYRCSAHAPLDEMPEILEIIAPVGRLYATLCEFQTQEFLGTAGEASAIVGLVGAEGGFRIEVRLNRGPLPDEEMAPWLETLLGLPVTYAPLPPFV